MYRYLILILIPFLSCTTGTLKVVADLPGNLKEASAIEQVANSDLLWTIEDSGNKNNLYGLNLNGTIAKDIDVSNSSNIDWEDLTSDAQGNIYIGDFGNNSKNRDDFTIYKISDLTKDETKAERINFTLPKKVKPKDFEAFFIFNNNFYIFSKENKSAMVFKVPNRLGTHVAKLLGEFKLKGKHLKVTAADISRDGKTIVLLNHDKLWSITNFKADDFLNGNLQPLAFKHNSQKEGICFKDGNSVYITDEKHKNEGGNLYAFTL